MNVRHCDRCGKRIEGSDYEDKYPTIIVNYEFCVDCLADLRKFMREKKREEKE